MGFNLSAAVVSIASRCWADPINPARDVRLPSDLLTEVPVPQVCQRRIREAIADVHVSRWN